MPERDDHRWLSETLKQESAPVSEACFDAEALAAWADGGLDVKAAAAVELHTSTCPRCLAVVASIERTAAASPSAGGWTLGRVFRWLVPLTAAATAVAIWIAVTDRPVTSVSPLPVQESPARVESPEPSIPPPTPAPSQKPSSETVNEDSQRRNVENRARSSEPATANRGFAPDLERLEPEAQRRLADQSAGERAAADTLGAAAGTAVASPPPAAPMAAPASPLLQEQAAAKRADAAGGDAAAAARGLAFTARIAVTNESTAPSNQLFRWRVLGSTEIERTTDGGKTWIKANAIPGAKPGAANVRTVIDVRAISDVSAVARTSDGREFYTADGGLVWAPLPQEK